MALPSYHQNPDGDSTGLMAAPLRRALCLAAVAAGNRGCTARQTFHQSGRIIEQSASTWWKLTCNCAFCSSDRQQG